MYAQTISAFAIFSSMEIIKNATETVGGVDAGDNVVVMAPIIVDIVCWMIISITTVAVSADLLRSVALHLFLFRSDTDTKILRYWDTETLRCVCVQSFVCLFHVGFSIN